MTSTKFIRRALAMAALSAFAVSVNAASVVADPQARDNTAAMMAQLSGIQAQLNAQQQISMGLLSKQTEAVDIQRAMMDQQIHAAGSFYAQKAIAQMNQVSMQKTDEALAQDKEGANRALIANAKNAEPAATAVDQETAMQMLEDTITDPVKSNGLVVTSSTTQQEPQMLMFKVITTRGKALLSSKDVVVMAQENQIAKNGMTTQTGYLESVSVKKKANGGEDTVFTPGVVESGLVVGVNWRAVSNGHKIAYVAVSQSELQSLANFTTDGKTVQLPAKAVHESFSQVALGDAPVQVTGWTDGFEKESSKLPGWLGGSAKIVPTRTVVLLGTLESFASFKLESVIDAN